MHFGHKSCTLLYAVVLFIFTFTILKLVIKILLFFLQDIETVSTEDLQLTIPTSTTDSFNTELNSVQPQKGRSHKSIGKSPRKRRTREDSDEDYVPPARMGRKRIKLSSKPSDFSYSDLSSDEEEEEKVVRRGRPPKRQLSVSSESSKDCDAVRYRELRDKNNEASRRSRLKRKMKEMTLETEAEGLEERNIKLKTEVAELERTVNNFRTNLFKIMLSK